ncbi:MAG: 3-phosphoshikimate 1-carboxyvinyltransferase [Ferruginibacter sp.]|nr:3-phosphoshikimate 1-carboxyvinyltransferase [Ferruginibacter sp.]
MQVTIQPGNIEGTLVAPASKSSMQRACAAALLHAGTTTIINPGKSNDDIAALEVIQQLGAVITLQHDGTLLITGNPSLSFAGKEDKTISCGESGLGIRMFSPIAAIADKQIRIEGTGSLVKRPMNFFDEIFPLLGVQIKSNDGKLPIVIEGPLKPVDISIDGSLSSQFLTGLLFAFAKTAKKSVCITVSNLKSTPYIDLTLGILKHFGYKVEHNKYEKFFIEPVSEIKDSILYTVEGDWSGASFLLVAGAIAGDITVKGLDAFSTQADKAILQALMSSSAHLSITEKEVSVKKPSGNSLLKPFQFDATHCPDLFPPLVALAAYGDGTSVIEGVGRLTHKESNRALTLQDSFGKLGVQIDLQDDLMLVHGGKGVKGGNIHSHHDHRIAMAGAVAALSASSSVIIEEADAINKSYPDFYDHINSVIKK